MGKWADDAFDRLRRIEGPKHEELQRAAHTRHHITVEAPRLWKQVVDVFKKEIEDFSTKHPDYLSIDDNSNMRDSCVSLYSPQMSVEVCFESDGPRLTYRALKLRPGAENELAGTGTYTVNLDDDDVWLFDHNQQRRRPPVVAQIILDWLIHEKD